ncbi:MAG: T9SS type A sorting domain-containing protein, partial [Acidobacteriota bacterium]
ILNCTKTGQNSWRTEFTDKNILAKAGAAVTDLAGNLSKKLINFLPDDFFVDNEQASKVKTTAGSWANTTDYSCFETSCLKATVDASTGASITVLDTLPQAGKYNLFVQFAKVDNPVDSLQVTILKDGSPIDTLTFNGGLNLRSWIYLSTITSSSTSPIEVRISTGGSKQAGKVIAFDALKTSALVRDKQIFIKADFADLGDIIVEKETVHNVVIENKGTDPLVITGVTVAGPNSSVSASFPITIASMQNLTLPVKVVPQKTGFFADTVKIASNDPARPIIKTVIKGNSVNYFMAIDNDESSTYYQESGTWAYSSAKGYASSSRFAYLDQKPGAKATFTKQLEKSGTYDFLHTVPVTVNASNHALYVLSYGTKKDTFYVDQNKGSGSWVKLAARYLEAGSVKVEIIDAGGNTNPNAVLRADAVRFNFLTDVNGVEKASKNVPSEFALRQNYPNPFNPSTVINYSLPSACDVVLKVYDVLGTEVATLYKGMQSAGEYNFRFNPQASGAISSGIYFYMLRAVPTDGREAFTRTMKMMYMK